MGITCCEKVKEKVKWLFDPLILRCYGWQSIPTHTKIWEDPKTGDWISQNEAIRICEDRIKLKRRKKKNGNLL